MRLSKPKLVSVAYLLLMLLLPFSAVAASNYDVVFRSIGYYNSELQLGSPQRDGNWDVITSKWNQPRSCSDCSNPHRGTDLAIPAFHTVHAVANGKIVDIVNHGYDWDYVTMSIDGTNKYVSYVHINPDSKLYIGRPVSKGESLGTVANIAAPHLHIGVQTSYNFGYLSDDVWSSNAPYWRTVSEWRSGRDLDLFAFEYFSNNRFSIDGYVGIMSNGNQVRESLTEVKIYHKPSWRSWWSSDNMSVVSGTNNLRWQYDFNGKYTSGELVEIVIVGYRNLAGYNHAIFPAHFRQPSDNPADWSYSRSYLLEIQ